MLIISARLAASAVEGSVLLLRPCHAGIPSGSRCGAWSVAGDGGAGARGDQSPAEAATDDAFSVTVAAVLAQQDRHSRNGAVMADHMTANIPTYTSPGVSHTLPAVAPSSSTVLGASSLWWPRPANDAGAARRRFIATTAFTKLCSFFSAGRVSIAAAGGVPVAGIPSQCQGARLLPPVPVTCGRGELPVPRHRTMARMGVMMRCAAHMPVVDGCHMLIEGVWWPARGPSTRCMGLDGTATH